MFIILGQ